MQWADVIWTERQEEQNANFDLDVTDRLDERPDLSMDEREGPPPAGVFHEDPVLETLKDQVYKQRQLYSQILESGKIKDENRRQAMIEVVNQLD
jgi:hypothetical protein